MTKFMTHLEAFLSDDAKRGRVWTDEAGYKYRNHGCILHVMETDGPDAGKWRDSLLQVAALNGAVTWADEPKTLTPQEIALHMGNGGCVADLNGYVFRLGSGSPIIETWIERERQWQSVLHDWIGERNAGFLFGCRAVPDPSQPAEQPKPAFKKYCDDCTNSWALPSWRPCKKCEAVRSVQSKPAEPQVEYPLTFEDACLAAKRGALVTNERYPYVTYGIINGVRQVRSETKGWRGDDWGYSQTERGARWRIVDGGK